MRSACVAPASATRCRPGPRCYLLRSRQSAERRPVLPFPCCLRLRGLCTLRRCAILCFYARSWHLPRCTAAFCGAPSSHLSCYRLSTTDSPLCTPVPDTARQLLLPRSMTAPYPFSGTV